MEDCGRVVDIRGREPSACLRSGEREQLNPSTAGLLDHFHDNITLYEKEPGRQQVE